MTLQPSRSGDSVICLTVVGAAAVVVAAFRPHTPFMTRPSHEQGEKWRPFVLLSVCLFVFLTRLLLLLSLSFRASPSGVVLRSSSALSEGRRVEERQNATKRQRRGSVSSGGSSSGGSSSSGGGSAACLSARQGLSWSGDDDDDDEESPLSRDDNCNEERGSREWKSRGRSTRGGG